MIPILGGLFGLALAIALALLLPGMGFWPAFCLGVGLSGFGILFGMAADR